MSKDNPQLEDGYTKIANKILEDILLADLNKEELKLTLAIVRKTYGWNKKADKISYSQMAELTGIDRRHIGRGVKSLLYRDLICRANVGRTKFGKPVYKYWINKKSWHQCGVNTGANAVSLTGANAVLTKERKKTLKKGKKSLVDKMNMRK
jgi:phage replication O-like protein O